MTNTDLRQRVAELEAELARLRQSERRYDLLAESSGLMVYDYDVAAATISWSGNTLGVAGYEPAELAGGVAEWEALIHPDDRAEALALLDRAAASLERYEVEYRFQHKAGGHIWVLDRGFFIPGPDGAAARMIGMMQDVGEQRRAIAELRRAKERNDLLSAAAGLVVYEYDVAAGTLEWSGELGPVLGYQYADLNGPVERWAERIHPDDRAEALRQFELAEHAVSKYEIEYRFRHRDGRYLWLFDRGFFLAGPSGAAARMVGMMQDVSDRKQAELERAALQEQVIAAQQAALRELSTPLIPVSDDVVVLPLVGAMDTGRAQQVMEALLVGVEQRRARVAILDITGVSVVDTQVANALIQAAQAARLLGARVVLTGIRPEVAQTLVGLGVDLGTITTRATLQDGIAAVLRG